MRKTMAGLALPLDSVRNPKPMRKWMVRGGIFLGVLLAIAGATYYWLIDESHVPSGARFALDIGTVRQLANSIPGAKPQQIRVEQLAVLRFPASALVAGNGWSKSDITVLHINWCIRRALRLLTPGWTRSLATRSHNR